MHHRCKLEGVAKSALGVHATAQVAVKTAIVTGFISGGDGTPSIYLYIHIHINIYIYTNSVGEKDASCDLPVAMQ